MYCTYIPVNNIIIMCLDTLASNTGRNHGSTSLFEQKLGKSIKWLACCHHNGALQIYNILEAPGPRAGMGIYFGAL